MPRTTLDRLRGIFPQAKPYLMYGLTEAFRSTYLDPAEVDRRPDSIGKAIPNAEILVVRPDGTLCGPDEPGELVHRGALVAMGYWNDAERTAERFRPAPGQPSGIPLPEIAVWSGDLVRRDDEGFLYFVGRLDEMIKTSGYRVSPTEVEEVVYSSGLVGEAVALGLPHPSLGQGIVVVATPPAGGALDVSALTAACRRSLPQYMVPLLIAERVQLPRNPNGKIDRKVLAAELAGHVPGEGAVTAAAPARHPALAAFPVRDGCLMVGGMPLTALAERVGRTPFFAYDRRLLDERIAHLRRHLPPSVSLHYAIKANPMPAVVQHLAPLVDGFDVASAQEMKVALAAPMAAEHVGFAGPGKTPAELRQAVAAGILIEIESPREMRSIADIGAELGRRPRVAVRVNPDFEVKASGMRMGGGPQQFGVDAEQVPALLREMAPLGLDFRGFHIFAGSQNLTRRCCRPCRRARSSWRSRSPPHAPAPVRYLNIGGGFGIPYFPKDAPLDIAPIGKNLARLIAERLQPALPEARVVIELGRYIVGEAGIYVARVLDRKEIRGQIFLVTDGGLHHQLAASGNFGQVIRRNYPVAIGNRMGETKTEVASVVGCLCTPLDLLADRAELARAEVGDLVVVFQSGAYGLTASPINFLSHPVPPEVLV